jgi:hypothetical protein
MQGPNDPEVGPAAVWETMGQCFHIPDRDDNDPVLILEDICRALEGKHLAGTCTCLHNQHTCVAAANRFIGFYCLIKAVVKKYLPSDAPEAAKSGTPAQNYEPNQPPAIDGSSSLPGFAADLGIHAAPNPSQYEFENVFGTDDLDIYANTGEEMADYY